MKSNILFYALKNHLEQITKLIISNIQGASISSKNINVSDVLIKKIPFIEKHCSASCKNCGAYNECDVLKECHNCENKLSNHIEVKYTTNIYSSISKYIPNYAKDKFMLVTHDTNFANITQDTLKSEGSKIVVHISPFFNFKRDFMISNLNLNHVFLNWNESYRLFNVKTIRVLFKQISDQVYEEKNNTILWKKITPKIFPLMIKDILLMGGHKKVKLGGEGPDQGKDLLSELKKQRWLTQCKFYKNSSVSADEIKTLDWLSTHKCNSYRLAALKVSGSLVTKLHNINKAYKEIKEADYWDETDLRKLLVKYDTIRIKYFGR